MALLVLLSAGVAFMLLPSSVSLSLGKSDAIQQQGSASSRDLGTTFVTSSIWQKGTNEGSRRRALLTTMATAGNLASSLLPLPSLSISDEGDEKTLSVADILSSLSTIPAFCIVNRESGAAYMLYKAGEGFARGYAFLTYKGALKVLEDAQQTAQKGGYADVWEDAVVTTIPADIALRLTLKPKERTSQKDQTASSILAMIPGEDEREAAMRLDKERFKDQGKVPLFYFDTMAVSYGETSTLPLYFNPRDLLEAWKEQQQSDLDRVDAKTPIPPRIQAVDLDTMVQLVLRKRASELPFRSNKVVFVPNAEAVKSARDLKAKGLAPYQIDRMIV